jgi:hypothetical protein
MTIRDPRTDAEQRPAASQARRRPRLEISATQLIASALAAITATIAASYLGVSGTVIGAAVASVLTVIGNAVYSHSLRSTGERVREVVPVAVRFGPRAGSPTGPTVPRLAESVPARPAASPASRPRTTRPGRRKPKPAPPWRRLVLGAAAVFATVLAVVTSVEVVAGRPISDLLRGDTGSGTTLFGATSPATTTTKSKSKSESTPATPPSTLTVTQTVTPSVVATTPTVTETAAPVTTTTTPTRTTSVPATPSSTAATPTGTGTPSPTASP